MVWPIHELSMELEMETKPTESTGLVVDQKISSTFIDKIRFVFKLFA
jgi:hypothetical protein